MGETVKCSPKLKLACGPPPILKPGFLASTPKYAIEHHFEDQKQCNAKRYMGVVAKSCIEKAKEAGQSNLENVILQDQNTI